MTTIENVLAHYGVKGMKWGTRKQRKNAPSSDALSARTTRVAAKSKGIHTVSNAELQQAIRRMQLEQDFSRLSAGAKNNGGVKKWVSKTLTEIGTQEIKRRAGLKLAGVGAAKVAGKVAAKAATGGIA